MRTDTVYKKAFNRTANMLRDGQLAGELPSENELRRRMCVSRTTVRKVLQELIRRQLVTEHSGIRAAGRAVDDNDYYPDAETTPRAKHVEQHFMEWMLRRDTRPGTSINELELARQFGVATNGIREFLIRFSRFGLIEKRPNTGWLFKGFTEDFALELFEIRVMFELRSAHLFSRQPGTSPLWGKLAALKIAHTELLKRIEIRYHDFSGLDNRFHRLINEASPNRFIDDFYDVITFIFHYHYQWNKQDEKQRNQAAILEHVAYIDALESRDPERIKQACQAHLASARTTLMRSLIGLDQ
ncbi:MAG: GntR family transcriptional regulator [Mesorhizobium sp.]|nr:GntR family transcriptional regulator [bacterium M00.F.Ca.ET.205.01.1.1]TGU50631.1 GntR family transcriptional regulator [bacterium M00.F.Ca.ET.152.01.1.1]TGV34089.1 GntR family transcriptional regulator [Mesorhizobium sp. M00.F.Ca.ET.186.01.1.1]TGZ40995.1 GntR family transcriptional regulator [bacterium M00.F.Ca.ET.162.01.1.1]TJW32029.1 MAG: GntR family transcriptional regulator [Mesorhizobium sp.]